jgi:hypothetical protein
VVEGFISVGTANTTQENRKRKRNIPISLFLI